jgi:hypothetical protein
MFQISTIMEVLSWVVAILSLFTYYALTKEKISSSSNKYQGFSFVNNIFFVLYNVYKTSYSFAFLSFLFAGIAAQHLINNIDFTSYKNLLLSKINR